MRKIVLAALLTTGLLAALAGFALATPSFGVTSTPLAQGTLPSSDVDLRTGDWKIRLKTVGHSDVSVTEIKVAAGGYFGWHSHPGPSLVIVKSGTSTFYRGDDPHCRPEVHPAGTAYIDPGGVVHTARNEGTEELVLLVTRLSPSGAAPRIDQPAPGNCNF